MNSDPAVEAARRAWESGPDEVAKIPFRADEDGLWSELPMVSAAREALKPIKDWFAWWNSIGGGPLPEQAWGELARLVYPSEELS